VLIEATSLPEATSLATGLPEALQSFTAAPQQATILQLCTLRQGRTEFEAAPPEQRPEVPLLEVEVPLPLRPGERGLPLLSVGDRATLEDRAPLQLGKEQRILFLR